MTSKHEMDPARDGRQAENPEKETLCILLLHSLPSACSAESSYKSLASKLLRRFTGFSI